MCVASQYIFCLASNFTDGEIVVSNLNCFYFFKFQNSRNVILSEGDKTCFSFIFHQVFISLFVILVHFSTCLHAEIYKWSYVCLFLYFFYKQIFTLYIVPFLHSREQRGFVHFAEHHQSGECFYLFTSFSANHIMGDDCFFLIALSCKPCIMLCLLYYTCLLCYYLSLPAYILHV